MVGLLAVFLTSPTGCNAFVMSDGHYAKSGNRCFLLAGLRWRSDSMFRQASREKSRACQSTSHQKEPLRTSNALSSPRRSGGQTLCADKPTPRRPGHVFSDNGSFCSSIFVWERGMRSFPSGSRCRYTTSHDLRAAPASLTVHVVPNGRVCAFVCLGAHMHYSSEESAAGARMATRKPPLVHSSLVG
jgi:hypothetical protein